MAINNKTYFKTKNQNIIHLIALIDDKINKQLNTILHHKTFQRLESSWRGLYYLAENTKEAKSNQIKIKILDINYNELALDITYATEFDQSSIFHKIYTSELDQPGGEPFGVIIGDYYISHKPNLINMIDGCALLEAMASIAACAFVPFIASADPTLFNINEFSELHNYLDLETTFKQEEYYRWNKFRKQQDSRFIALLLPKILMRTPYHQSHYYFNNLLFSETINKHDDYLWGNVIYIYANVVVQSFYRTGWFNEIYGETSYITISDIARHDFKTDKNSIASKHISNLYVSNQQEKSLADLGFIALSDNIFSNSINFYTSQSIQQTHNMSSNFKVNSQLEYLFCISRFAHYIKIIMRDKIGSYITSEDCEAYLQKWILQYCSASTELNSNEIMRFPLSKAKIKLSENPAKPGMLNCIILLQLHYHLSEIETQLRLVTQFK